MIGSMKHFTLTLVSTDPNLLDGALRDVSDALRHPETQLTINVLPVEVTAGERLHRRKLHIDSNDFHLMPKLQKYDLPRNVRLRLMS
jgi:ribosomal protein S10